VASWDGRFLLSQYHQSLTDDVDSDLEILVLFDLDAQPHAVVAQFLGGQEGAFSADGKFLAYLANDGTIRVWDLASNPPTERHTLRPADAGGADFINSPVFVKSGFLLTSDSEDKHWVWTLSESPPRALYSFDRYGTLYGGLADAVSVVGTGLSLRSVSEKHSLPVGPPVVNELNSHHGIVREVEILPGANRLVTLREDGAVQFWEVTADKVSEISPLGPAPQSVLMLGDALAVQDDHRQLQRWTPAPTGWETLAVPGEKRRKLLSRAQGKRIAIQGPQPCELWDFGADQPSAVTTLDVGAVSAAAISTDSSRIALGLKGKIEIWDLQANPPSSVQTLPLAPEESPGELMFLEGDRYLAGVGDGLSLWNLRRKNPLRERYTTSGFLDAGVMSWASELLVVPGYDTVVLKESPSGFRRVALFGGASTSKNCVAIAPDGRRVAVARHEYPNPASIEIRDWVTGEILRSIPMPGPMLSISWTPDGRHLVVHNANRTVYVLRLAPPDRGPSFR
jgi:WD40 repeat protein